MSDNANHRSVLERAREFLVEQGGDLSIEARGAVPGNFLAIVGAYFFTRLGDALISPKVTLVWLLSSLGAPLWMTALLVPIRESGSMIPQLIIAGCIRRQPVRKWVWVIGSILQGLLVVGMALTALWLEGAAAGWSILGCVTLFALARGLCSVAAKDVLGKTIPRGRRGRVNGVSASVAGVATLVVATLLWAPELPDGALIALLLAAAGLWLAGAAVYSTIRESAGATDGSAGGLLPALSRLSLLWRDARLRHFVMARALLLSTALSAPFYVLLSREHANASLGYFLFAQGVAALVGGPMWGRFADRSSRAVMVSSGSAAALLGFAVVGVEQFDPQLAGSAWFYPLVFFALMLAHDGVRLGRKTYVVDMATGNQRTDYVAVSNSVIGLLLLVAGLSGALVQVYSPVVLIALLALMALAGALVCRTLPEP